MRQAVMQSPGSIEHKNVDPPGALKNNEVLLKIKKIGVCGSDIHVYHGEHPATPYPVIQGHEYSAEVIETGSSVTKISTGMRATGRPQLTCGVCSPCKRNQYNICQNLKVQGFQAPGVAQDFFIMPENRVVPFPQTMTFDEGAMIEPAAVGAHATNRTSSLKNKNVVVSGAGTIGNLVAQFAKFRGAKKVLITDIDDYRLEIAKACNIDETVNVYRESFEEKANELFGSEGFQVGFEAAGVQASLDVLLKNIEKGSEIVILGVYAENPRVNMFYLGEHELKVIGSLMYLHQDYLDAVSAISSSEINLTPLITHHFPFEKYAEAYRFIEHNKSGFMKVIIDM